MQLYWSLKSIPELADLPAAERARAWRGAQWKIFRHWQVWLALFGCGLAAAVGSSLGELTGYRTAGLVIGAAIGAFGYGQTAVHFARPHIREQLQEAEPES